MTNKKGVSRGFGFVQFTDPECASKAIEVLNGKMMSGKIIHVDYFIPQRYTCWKTGPKFNKLYVRGFDQRLTDEGLKELFSEFGQVIKADVQRSAEGVSRGFGFVYFKVCSSAVKAIDAMHGEKVNGRTLYVSRFKDRRKRKGGRRQKRVTTKKPYRRFPVHTMAQYPQPDFDYPGQLQEWPYPGESCNYFPQQLCQCQDDHSQPPFAQRRLFNPPPQHQQAEMMDNLGPARVEEISEKHIEKIVEILLSMGRETLIDALDSKDRLRRAVSSALIQYYSIIIVVF